MAISGGQLPFPPNLSTVLFISSSMLSLRSPVRLCVETTDTSDNVALSDISLGCANANWIDMVKEIPLLILES